VIQYWFYLLSQGGSGVNDLNNPYAVTGLGLTKAAQILYRAENFYDLGSYINIGDGSFYSARTTTILAAIDLFGDNSCEVISLKNAWHAVGVGDAYVNSSNYTISVPQGQTLSPICTTKQYTLNNQPSGSTVTWTASPSNLVSFNTTTSNPTTVTKMNDGIVSSIYATITSGTGCVLGTSVLVSNVVVGKPTVTSTGPLMIYSGPGDENDVCRYEGTEFDLTYSGATSIVWSGISHQGGSWPSWSQTITDDVYVEFFTEAQNTLVLQMDASNACGTTSYQFGFHAIDCGGRMASPKKLFIVSPNPTNSSITISPIEKLDKSESKSITEVIVSDFSGNIFIRRKFGDVRSAQLYVGNIRAGLYNVKIICGTYFETQTIRKN